MPSSMPVFSRYLVSNYFLCFFSIISITFIPARSSDAGVLLALKASLDPLNKLNWGGNGSNVCHWTGVKECRKGRITKLVVESLGLNGTLDQTRLNQLDQLRVLSFKENSISGPIPTFSGLVNLKSLYLNDNNFSGNIPSSISLPHRLKVVVLSNNQISGHIPDSLVNLPRLYVLQLQDNLLTGEIPPFNQTSLRFLNVSNNKLSGPIPYDSILVRFNESSFFNNVDLCGDQIHIPCQNPNISFGPSTSPSYPVMPKNIGDHDPNKKLIIILVPSIIGGLILASLVAITFILCVRSRAKTRETSSKAVAEPRGGGGGAGVGTNSGPGGGGGEGKSGGGTGGGFSWEEGGEGLGTLVFCGPGDQQMSYTLEDLLKASAETLGRGTIGSTYKAVMESGYIVTVKRLKEARYPRIEEFRRHVELIGKLRHPNLVPLRAYFQAKEERLLVYDYFPNGSLFSLIHGSRASGGSKPLHWTSCLKIAEDLATGLLYIHQNPGLVHGNLKSSNILLGSDFESCLTDYGLTSFRNPDSLDESTSSLFYRAPECRDNRRAVTQQADVYSFGVLLLELLTGKTPFQDLVEEHGSDIPRWVRSVREEETESGDEPASSNEASEEKLAALLNIAMGCVSLAPENRPTMRDVLRLIREVRAEPQVSSNSSDHSPGRWSDTVQSLPRDEHLSI